MSLKKIKEKILNFIISIPITIKVTIWYTTFIIILIITLVAGSFFTINELSSQSSKKDLVEGVSRLAEHRERFNSIDDGVYYSIYNDKNEVLMGVVPKDFNNVSKSIGTVSEFRSGDKLYFYYDMKVLDRFNDNSEYVRGIIEISNVQKELRTFPLLILIISPFFIAIVTYGGYRIIKAAFKPVRNITAIATEIEKSGNLSRRINLAKGKDEIHRLGIVLNNMLETLEKSYNREKKFSSDVSHELRTPVSVILAESEYGLKYIDTLDEAKNSLSVIERQSKRMTTMINQILEISRIDQLEKLNLENINLSKMVKKMLEDYDKILVKNNIKIISNIKDNINVDIDKILMERVIDNIFLNAVKFTQSEITINLYKQKNKIILEIIDDGEGIPQDEIENIWLRFYKVDKSRTNTDNTSSGLGLSITKKIVELHNGKITAENNLPKGAKFKVEI